MTAKPIFILLAGPNGAGKTSLASKLLAELAHNRLNPDEIAIELAAVNPELGAIAAGQETLRRIDHALAARTSFAVETTLSGHGYFRRAANAQQQGWQVILLYVGLSDPELAIQRVRSRVEVGGHGVPPADVRRRYGRSMANLARFCRLAEFASLYDNSGPPPAGIHLLSLQRGRVVSRAAELPVWLKLAMQGFEGSLR
ncbi:MAG: zeta toxin family protein [Alphaproteobacteria bacterium]|nr:zeta toxin family protein [Alphaproteobacteria bacterium]